MSNKRSYDVVFGSCDHGEQCNCDGLRGRRFYIELDGEPNVEIAFRVGRDSFKFKEHNCMVEGERFMMNVEEVEDEKEEEHQQESKSMEEEKIECMICCERVLNDSILVCIGNTPNCQYVMCIRCRHMLSNDRCPQCQADEPHPEIRHVPLPVLPRILPPLMVNGDFSDDSGVSTDDDEPENQVSNAGESREFLNHLENLSNVRVVLMWEQLGYIAANVDRLPDANQLRNRERFPINFGTRENLIQLNSTARWSNNYYWDRVRMGIPRRLDADMVDDYREIMNNDQLENTTDRQERLARALRRGTTRMVKKLLSGRGARPNLLDPITIPRARPGENVEEVEENAIHEILRRNWLVFRMNSGRDLLKFLSECYATMEHVCPILTHYLQIHHRGFFVCAC